MKKTSLFLLPLLIMTACGSGSKAGSDSAKAVMDQTEFDATQPLESGEYAATYFEYAEPDGQRSHFDGRLLVAADPEQTVAYVYENGNRTKFTAQVNLAKPFEKNDTVYTSTDAKDRKVTLIVGSQADTLCFEKADKQVKVAFDKQPLNTLTPEAAREAIIAKRTK